MDAESSSKFIGSLTKFLQSLCNGYVDFEDGVELIGHIYLSVDTGKKIDYILNEKVCKSDNSVTFISNSFHAQPLDKLKTISSKKTSEDKTPDGAGRKEEEALLLESGDGPPRSTQINTALGRNHGSLPSGQVTQNRSSAVKRPGSPLTPRKAPTPPQRRPSTPPSQRRSQLQAASAKGSLGSPASSKNVPSSPSSSSLDNAPSPSSRLKANQPSTETASGDADSDILVPPNILAVAQVPDLSSFLGATGNEGQDATAHEQGLATSDDETKPDTDITFIKEEFIPSASSCAQAGTSGQSSGRSLEEQVHDSGSSSGLYPVMLHQNTAAFSNAGGVYPPSFPSLGNATATSTSTSQASTDIFANPVPGTSNQDSSSGDPSAQCSGTASRTRVLGLLTEKAEPGEASGIASHAELPKRRASSGHSGLPDLNFGLPLPLPLSVPPASQPLSFLSSALLPGLPQHKGQVPPMMLDASYIGIFGGRPGRKCRRCGQEFLSQEDFEDHVDFCRRKMLACDYCDMCFRRRFNLKVHLRCRHGIGEQLVCPACGLNFRSKVRLLRHDCAASKRERSEDA